MPSIASVLNGLAGFVCKKRRCPQVRECKQVFALSEELLCIFAPIIWLHRVSSASFPTSFTRVDNSKTVRRVKLKSRRKNSWAVNDFVPVALLFLWRKSVGTLHKSRSTTKLWKVEIRNSLCFSRLCTKSTSPLVVGWGFCAWRRQGRKKLKKWQKSSVF